MRTSALLVALTRLRDGDAQAAEFFEVFDAWEENLWKTLAAVCVIAFVFVLNMTLITYQVGKPPASTSSSGSGTSTKHQDRTAKVEIVSLCLSPSLY